jgi:antitoxin component of RelBE/YafQ-DinJ toxin-antitoxin module
MTVLFRCRVNKLLLDKAEKVAQSVGTSTGEMVRIFLAEIARTGRVPVILSLERDSDALVSKTARNRIMRSLDDTKSWFGNRPD